MNLNSTTSRIHTIVSLALIFISTNFLFSQTQEWIVYTNGKYINCLADEGEYLWIGTEHGGLVKLNKSNGDFIIYDKLSSGLPSNWVNAIAIDGQGNKWIGTNGGGLAKFDGVSWTVYNSSNSGLPSNYVVEIAIDGQGNKWIAAARGLAKFDGVNWTVYNTSNSGLPSDWVTAIAIDDSGNKWIGTHPHWPFSGGLAKFDGVNWTVYNTSNSGLPDNWVWAIAIDEQGNKWIGTDGGLAKFDGVNWTVYNRSNSGLPHNDVYAIAIDGRGNKWIGTHGGGVAKFDGINWTVYNILNSGLPDNYVHAIAIDRGENIWVGTYGEGLVKFDGTNWTFYNTSNSGLPEIWVRVIGIDQQENKWIGTDGGGLAKFDGVNWTVYNRSNSGLPENWVLAITIDGQGNKWIGTNGGLAKFDGVNWTVYNSSNSGLPSNYVRAIAIDDSGNKWVGTDGGGIAKFDGVNWTVYKTSNSGLPSDWVWAIAIDGQGNKWIGTGGGGLAKFDGVNWTVYNTSNSNLPSNSVNAIAIDRQGNKWIGTGPYWNGSDWVGGGLAKFDGVNWTVYNTLNSNLPSNDVRAIAIDRQGNKWIGAWGLAKFDGVNWTVYNTSNSGLPYDEVRAVAIDGVGNKWIGTSWGGLAVYREGGVILFPLYVSASKLKFGEVYISNSMSLKLKIKNGGSQTISLNGVSFSRGDVFRVLNSFPINLAPNDSVLLDFVFKPLSSVVYEDTATISTSVGSFKIYLEGRGVRPPYLSGVDSVNFGLVVFGDSLSKSLWVKNTGEIDTVRISNVEVDAPFYVRGVSKSVLPPGDSARIDLVLKGELDGYRSSVLRVISNAWNDTLRVVLFGEIRRLAKISYRFNSIDFGSVYVGRDLDRGLMIYNVGSDTLRITGISVRDSVRFRYVGSLPLNVVMGDSVELRFRFRPDGSGSWVDSVLIRNNSVNDSLFKLVLRGRGVRPPYLSSVDSVNFGLVVFGDSLSKSLWVKNTGEIDTVRISNVEVDAPFYVRGVSKFVLRPGDSTKIDLVLKGEVGGYRSSVLKVISNAWNDTFKVSLYGAVTPFKQFTSFKQVQSGVVKFVYQVQTTSTFDLKKFEYSTDGVSWVESKNISGSTTITGTKTDTIYWDSKKDLPNFELLNVKVRFTFTGGGVDFTVVLNAGVDNKPPSFTGVKGHSFLGFNRVKLLFNRGVDISKFDYIVSFVDTVDRVYRFYRTSLDSVVLGGFYSVAGYVFYVRCIDEFGNGGDSLRYDVKFPAVGDYNFDGKIDAYDLGVFVLGWTNRDSVCDFYPFEGRVPVVRVVGDKKLDAGDVWVFTMFWDRGKRGGFGKVSELSVEGFRNERGMNLRYSGGYVTIGFDDFDVSGRFVSGGVEIFYDRGSFRFDSLLFEFDGLKLSYVDSSGGVFYLDFGRGGGFDFERLGARVRFRVLREVKEGMIVKLKLYDEGLKLFERSYRISFEEVPTEYALYQNYPNPFNPSTTIEFDIPERTNVKLIIYDILGREVETLIDKELEPGKYKINFTTTNLPSGVYFYTLRTPKSIQTKKMLLIK
jgi:ligand-binding sensor domain-containing protein